jgi:hypothetical protein
MMSKREAIDILRAHISYLSVDKFLRHCKLIEALKIAIEALEK